MPYIVGYDEIYDESFQIEISQEEYEQLKTRKRNIVSENPFPNLPIKSRYLSIRHPEFYDDPKEVTR